MYADALLLLSDAQALTATGNATNVIDLGDASPARDLGAGEPMGLVVTIDAAAVATGTYQVALVQSDNDDLSSPNVIASRTIAPADLGAGTVHVLPVPPNAITKRYLGAAFTLGGTTPGVTVTAYIGPMSMIEARRDYASGFSISG